MLPNNIEDRLKDLTVGRALVDVDMYTFIEHHWGCYNEWYNKYIETGVLEKFIANKNIDSIVDLGANTGSIAGLLTRCVKQMNGTWPGVTLVVEPNPDNIPLLITTMQEIRAAALNIHNHDLSVKVSNTACLYSKNKTSSMSSMDDNRGGFFISEIKEIKKEKEDIAPRGGNVVLLSFEDILSSADISHVDLLKLDVEGAEWNIIEHSTSIKNDVDNIIIEIHDKSVEEAREFFSANLPMFEIIFIEHEQFFLERKKA